MAQTLVESVVADARLVATKMQYVQAATLAQLTTQVRTYARVHMVNMAQLLLHRVLRVPQTVWCAQITQVFALSVLTI